MRPIFAPWPCLTNRAVPTALRRDKRQEMHRSPVIAIKLDAFRHALLLDEDAQANRQGLRHLSI